MKYTEDTTPTVTPPLHCRLKVKNFLTLKDIDMEFKGVNVIIGPQAEGKSLILKLLYFFYENFNRNISNKFMEYAPLEETYELSEKRFYEIFGYSYVKNNAASIEFYNYNNLEVYIKIGRKFSISYGGLFINRYNELIITNKKNNTEANGFGGLYELPENVFANPTIIIDSRITLTSFLNKNIYKFIAHENSNSIDSLLRAYSSIYERWRNDFSHTSNYDSEKLHNHSLDAKIYPIVKGCYRILHSNEYLLQGGERTPLDKTSSGQQVALPILLGLENLSSDNFSKFIGIEEPEAHLYPIAQKKILEEIVAAHVNRGRKISFCLTTHSPYLLSTLNNCITAAEVLRTGDEAKIARMEAILPREKWLPFEDVRCYYLEDGKAISLMDEEYRVIDASRIDTASEQLASDLSKMLDILE